MATPRKTDQKDLSSPIRLADLSQPPLDHPLRLFPLLPAGRAFLPTVGVLQSPRTVKVLLKPLRIWNVETIPESANRVQIEWFPGVVSKHLAKHMYVNIQGSRISHVVGVPNLLH